jgi:hypothetical protein
MTLYLGTGAFGGNRFITLYVNCSHKGRALVYEEIQVYRVLQDFSDGVP